MLIAGRLPAGESGKPANSKNTGQTGGDLIDQLVQARREGLDLVGEGQLLQQLSKRVLEGKITDHIGYGKHDPAGKDSGKLPEPAPPQVGD